MPLTRYQQSLLGTMEYRTISTLVAKRSTLKTIVTSLKGKGSSERVDTISALVEFARDQGKAARKLMKSGIMTPLSKLGAPRGGNVSGIFIANAQAHVIMSNGEERTFTNIVVDVPGDGTVRSVFRKLSQTFDDLIGSHYQVAQVSFEVRTLRS